MASVKKQHLKLEALGLKSSNTVELRCLHALACMAGRNLRQQSCIWQPQVTTCSSVAWSKSLSENNKLKALIKWFWIIFVSARLVSYQPFVSHYPPQRKEMYTCVSYKIAPQLHEDGGTVLRCGTCTKIPEREAYISFCWTHCGGSNQAESDSISNCWAIS